jgi:uncharacterized protein (DUF1501 family)
MKRRKFIKASAVISAPMLLKGFPVLASSSIESDHLNILANAAAACDKVLVIIQMNGGNDGLNTILPLDQWDKLFNARSNILMKENEVLPLKYNSAVGFHPAMPELKNLYDEGQMMVVQGVSYPNPSYSHFRSTDILFTAADSDKVLSTGWVGRTLNELYPGYPTSYPNPDMPDPLSIQIGSNLPFVLQGPTITMGYSVPNPNDLINVINATTDPVPDSDYGIELKFLRLMKDQSNAYRESIQKAFNVAQANSATYPTKNELADQLKIVAKLINGGLKTPIYIVNHPKTHDTHEGQIDTSDKTKGRQATNLSILSQAVGAFMEDIKLMGKLEKVAGMTHSEFGRRIKSNDSLGTDHGAGAPVMFFGDVLNTNPRTVKNTAHPVSGMIGTTPVLPDNATVEDQVAMQFDFRQIYATVMEDWLCMSKTQISAVLGGNYEKIPIFRNGPKEVFDIGNAKNFISVYPNPVINGELTVNFEDSITSRIIITIYNLQGARVFSNSYTADGFSVSLSLSSLLPASPYILEMDYNGNKFYEKIVVV